MRGKRVRERTIRGAAVTMIAILNMGGCTGTSTSGNANSATRPTGTTTSSTPAAPTTPSSDRQRQYPLSTLPTDKVTINGHVFRVWLARENDAQRPGVLEEGLMFVRPEELAADQGMLFIFSEESVRSFWMRNTITPLDIAFARTTGMIVQMWQMPPLTLRTFESVEPVLFALEVKANTFAQLGIKEGDRLEVPDTVFTAP